MCDALLKRGIFLILEAHFKIKYYNIVELIRWGVAGRNNILLPNKSDLNGVFVNIFT